jgi:uncharacterized membrane protein YkoI
MKITFVGAALIAVAFSASRGHAQASYTRELPDSLKSQAKIAESAAAKTALAKVPKGEIASVELERENGKLLYSYDIKVAGKKGVEEVHVDAVTGKFLSMEHENPEAEKKEAADEAKAKTAPKPKKP